MKKRCYPKYSYYIFFALSLVMIIFSFFPLLFFTDDELVYKIVWSIMTSIGGLTMLIAAIINMQYYIIKDGVIMVICFGFIINKLKLNNCKFEVEVLPTYFSWITSIKEKWICIYANDEKNLKHFKIGCCNKRKEKRIQIVCNNKNKESFKDYLLK